MFLGAQRYLVCIFLFMCSVLLPAHVLAQKACDVEVYVRAEDGSLIQQVAVVFLNNSAGEPLQQTTTQSGYAKFRGLIGSRYNLEVLSSGYDRALQPLHALGSGPTAVTLVLKRVSEGHAVVSSASPTILAPKAMKDLEKALEALRSNKPVEARKHLDDAYRRAPNDPGVNYVFGVYFAQVKDWETAKTYWEKVLNLYPKHLGSLLSLAAASLRENKPKEAKSYLTKAATLEPGSWRAYALLADASFRLGSFDESIKQAERAENLGHGQADIVQPLLARALAKKGEKERGIQVLQAYLQIHPADSAAKAQLENLKVLPPAAAPGNASAAAPDLTPVSSPVLASSAIPLFSTWLPPNIDDSVPPVEPGVSCALDEVLTKVGKRIQELVSNTDRFTATEFLEHETIDKWGIAGSPESRKFDYVVSFNEVRPGLLVTDEYRAPRGSSLDDFPDGVKTTGLPALVLIFHPYNSVNFDMKCEGLARWNGSFAWQVYFRQRSDKPNTIRDYGLSPEGPWYPVALKGRAWIAVDSDQILRMETDLIAPLPEIRLMAEHTVIEYGPVHFRRGRVDMWLPKSAEVYYDWRGRRRHRRLTFSNYLLFSVGTEQNISAPKGIDTQ